MGRVRLTGTEVLLTPGGLRATTLFPALPISVKGQQSGPVDRRQNGELEAGNANLAWEPSRDL
jgi:hypothetical protein